MNIIKVNYNNAVVKKPNKLTPDVFYIISYDGDKNIFRIEVDPKLNENSFFTDFLFEIYFDDVLVGYINSSSTKNEQGRYEIELSEHEVMNNFNINLTIKGKYINNSNILNIDSITYPIINLLVCQNELYCSEEIICYNSLLGYLNDNIFYVSYENELYDGAISNPEELDSVFVDQHTMQLYKWNSIDNEYQLLY